MAVLLALTAAVLYGISDYAGGRASRRLRTVEVTLIAESVTLIALTLVVLGSGVPMAPGGDLRWGAAAGLAGLIGVLSLYHALAKGAMTVVAPVTAVVAAAIPVGVGLGLGERPSPPGQIGIAAALAAVALISGIVGIPHVRVPARLIGLAVLSGTGFGLLFVFYSRVDEASGWWPVLAARIVAFPILLVAASILAWRTRPDTPASVPVPQTRASFRDRSRWYQHRTAVALAVTVGAAGTVASLAYLSATHRGLLSIVAVVTSLYPASTVVLAMGLDGERIRRPQALGLGLAAVALALVARG